ncbi:MAG TPA: hypothetical protein VMS94_07225 [Acidobacteriota bacterium]|jgi:hypothetical protein|nr:hypothetical protein [Acidobacteriota bacterium]
MGVLNNKKCKKLDLMTMTDSEKIKLINEIKTNLRQKVVEAKLWQSLVASENLTINGETVHFGDNHLKGLSFRDLLKST